MGEKTQSQSGEKSGDHKLWRQASGETNVEKVRKWGKKNVRKRDDWINQRKRDHKIPTKRVEKRNDRGAKMGGKVRTQKKSLKNGKALELQAEGPCLKLGRKGVMPL